MPLLKMIVGFFPHRPGRGKIRFAYAKGNYVITPDDQIEKLADRRRRYRKHFFGKAVSVIINSLDPDIIVVGGGVGNIDAIYSEGAAAINQFIFNNYCDVPIVKPRLGDSAGVFGAAALT